MATIPQTPYSATAPVEISVTSTTVGASLSPDSASSEPTRRARQRHHAQHREDRRCVGRRGHGTEQDGELPRQSEQVVRTDGDHPDRDATPMVASENPSRIDGLASRQFVVSPPSARITARATKPSAWASSASSKGMPDA